MDHPGSGRRRSRNRRNSLAQRRHRSAFATGSIFRRLWRCRDAAKLAPSIHNPRRTQCIHETAGIPKHFEMRVMNFALGGFDGRNARLRLDQGQKVIRFGDQSFRTTRWRAQNGVSIRSIHAKCRLTRRFCLPFFSILPIRTLPISAVAATCVPPHGCKSISPIRTNRTRP